MGDDIILYGYWRSSAAYRVRICLNLKQLAYDSVSVHLVRNGGEQHNEQYHDLNASELVPVLVDGDLRLNQSLAIIQYLERKTTQMCRSFLNKRHYVIKRWRWRRTSPWKFIL